MAVRTPSRQRLLDAFPEDTGRCMHDAAAQAGLPAEKARQAVIDFCRHGLIEPAGTASAPHCRKPVQLYKRRAADEADNAGYNAREVLDDSRSWVDLSTVWLRGA